MSNHILAAFNINNFNFNPELFGKQLANFVNNTSRMLMTTKQEATSAEDAEDKFAYLHDKLKTPTLSGPFNTIVMLDGKPAHHVYSDGYGGYVSVHGSGKMVMSINQNEIEPFVTDGTLFTIPKSEMVEKLTNNTSEICGVPIITDPDNFIMGPSITTRVRDIFEYRLLETHSEYLDRIPSTHHYFINAINHVVRSITNVYSGNNGVMPNLTSEFFESLGKVYVDTVHMEISTFARNLYKRNPDFKETLLEYTKVKIATNLEIANQNAIKNNAVKVLSRVFNLKEEEKTSDKTLIASVSSRAQHTATDPKTNLWEYCRFLGSISFIEKGKMKYYDCGLWINDSGQRVSATFVDSNDHTSYHSTPMIENGEFVSTFLETNEVNQGTVLTAIQEWIMKEAISLNYAKG